MAVTAPQPNVLPIFATPFAIAALPEAEALNPAVAALLAARATPERADPANHQVFTFAAATIYSTGPSSRCR